MHMRLDLRKPKSIKPEHVLEKMGCEKRAHISILLIIASKRL